VTDGSQRDDPDRRGRDGHREQPRDELQEMTSGKGFRAQNDHRQAGERRQERAARAEDDHGAPGQQERGRDVGPDAQHPLAGADRGDVRQCPVVQVRVRVLRRQAEPGRAGQRLALIGERTMAQPDLFDGGLQPGAPGRVG
jgi:hypothetical protein